MYIEKLDLNNKEIKDNLIKIVKDNAKCEKEDMHIFDTIKIEKINNNIVINVNGFTGPYATYNKTLTIKLGDYSVDIASGNLEFNNEGFRKAFFGFMANNFASENKNEDYYHNFIKMMEMTIEGLFGKKIKFVEDEKKSDIKNWFNAKKQENEQENEQK